MYRTILLATDGSEPAAKAADRAFDFAARYDVPVHALFVVDTRLVGEPALSSTELVIDELEDRAHAHLEVLAERAEREAIDLTTRCCHGIPHDEILAAAEDVEADLLVLGSQGQSHQRTDTIGHVAERVARNATRPLLLV